MSLDQLTFGEITKLMALFGNKPLSSCCEESWGKQIVILQRGWVVIGDLCKSGEYFTLRGGSVIRNWGTTKGLGEIAKDGPTLKTVLEPVTETKFHELAVVGMIKCEK